jgi:hypothetical protein
MLMVVCILVDKINKIFINEYIKGTKCQTKFQVK